MKMVAGNKVICCLIFLFVFIYGSNSEKSIETIYDGCGVSKGCFASSDDCIGKRSCTAMLTYHVMGDKLHFEMLATPQEGRDPPGYIASGLSTDLIMANDSVIECVWHNQNGGAYAAWTTGPGNPRRNSIRENVPQDIIKLIDVQNIDGSLYCRVEKDVAHTIYEKHFNVINTTYYLMIASGTTVRENGIGMHNLDLRTTSSPVNFTQIQSIIDDSIYLGCGMAKTCFGFPISCVESKNCDYMATFYKAVDTVHYEMQAISGNPLYVASGLSLDNVMGEDSIIECVFQNGMVRAFASWTTPRNPSGLNAIRDGVNQSTISLIRGSYAEGKLYCKVSKDLVFSMHGMDFDVRQNLYYFMVAAGSNLRENGITRHNIGRMISDQALNITKISDSIGAGSRPTLIMIHAAFMIFAWIGTGAVGTFIARYFRGTWIGQKINGKDLWFSWHVILMSTTWTLHIAAFIIIFVHANGWTVGDNTHGIIGIVATVFIFFQPIGGLFRPEKDSSNRWLFNIIHWFCGIAAQILSVVAMFFAVILPRAELPDVFYWVLTAFVVGTFIVHGVLSISACIVSQTYVKNKSDVQSEIDVAEDSHALFRKLILTCYVLLAFACTVTLIVLATT